MRAIFFDSQRNYACQKSFADIADMFLSKIKDFEAIFISAEVSSNLDKGC
ncbi:MAG: hypothetical protein U5Q03_13665 [Bacteroidota bacterium]|nr:hypothetical protein [Bacteroidota bacterium]